VRLGVGHPGDKDLVHGHVLSDFAKADKVWLDKLLDAVSAEIPLLAAGEAPRFMSRVAEVMSPPRPHKPKPEDRPKPAKDGESAALPSPKSDD
jgi:PTH1 family peptidyl-tRNA hydrolase